MFLGLDQATKVPSLDSSSSSLPDLLGCKKSYNLPSLVHYFFKKTGLCKDLAVTEKVAFSINKNVFKVQTALNAEQGHQEKGKLQSLVVAVRKGVEECD